MIRVIIYLIVLAALAYGAVWLAERPGEVAITWQGERIDTSVMVLAAAYRGGRSGSRVHLVDPCTPSCTAQAIAATVSVAACAAISWSRAG
jgi:hypothetical protein